jgi:hypothetical protein
LPNTNTDVNQILKSQQAASAYPRAGIKIVEVGFNLPTCIDICNWLDNNPGIFTSVGLNVNRLGILHERLEAQRTALYATLLLQDPARYLASLQWLDVVFINDTDRGLQGGLELYRLAASTGARKILFTEYQSSAALAIKEAREHGWNYSTSQSQSSSATAYYILTRD